MTFAILPLFLKTALLISATVRCDEYASFHDKQYNSNYDGQDLPKFLAKPQRFSVELNGTITFPCDVDKVSGPYILMFKYISFKGRDRTLYAGDQVVGDYPRLRKEGNTFILSDIMKKDAGIYACRFESDPVVKVTHELNVKYPAQVQRNSHEIEKIPQGNTVTLKCNASGNPLPGIAWSKENGRLPSGATSSEGESITFEGVNRHVEGIYICTASNGIGEPASTKITLQVEYKPDIVTEQEILQKKDHSYEAQLVCIIHARPIPTVSWYKGEELVSSNKHIMHHDGSHRHSIQIKDVAEEDFGTYSCKATNIHGDVRKNLTLTGLPKTPNITSSSAGGEKEAYTLTWRTESFAPIIQYRVRYRKVMNNRTNRDPDGWNDSLFSPPKVTERDTSINEGVQEMNHRLRDLNPAADYETKIRVENKFGWSSQSDVFRFYTRKELAVGQSASSSTNLKLYPGLFVAVLAAVGQSTNSAQSVNLFTGLLVSSILLTLL